MIILLSPAKTLDFETEIHCKKQSEPAFISQAEVLIKQLRNKSTAELMKLMNISKDLAELNFERYQHWNPTLHKSSGRQAILAFKGDVYTGLDAHSFSPQDFEFADKHLRILSGLYGMLKPTDLILPHRLEMGTRLQVNGFKNLYTYWQSTLNKALTTALIEAGAKRIINLASVEYAKSVELKRDGIEVIAPEFKDYKNGQYKTISFFAKKARGLMASFIIREKINHKDQLKAFNQDGYHFNNELSTSEAKPVFTRG